MGSSKHRLAAWHSSACTNFFATANISRSNLARSLGYTPHLNGDLPRDVQAISDGPSTATYFDVGSVAERRESSPLTIAREDANCDGGRLAAMRWPSKRPHVGNEVILVPQLRIGYLVIRKCASTTIVRLREIEHTTASPLKTGASPTPSHTGERAAAGVGGQHAIMRR